MQVYLCTFAWFIEIVKPYSFDCIYGVFPWFYGLQGSLQHPWVILHTHSDSQQGQSIRQFITKYANTHSHTHRSKCQQAKVTECWKNTLETLIMPTSWCCIFCFPARIPILPSLKAVCSELWQGNIFQTSAAKEKSAVKSRVRFYVSSCPGSSATFEAVTLAW